MRNASNFNQFEDDESYYQFEHFWSTVVEYSSEIGLPISYVEEEFVIDGELIKQ